MAALLEGFPLSYVIFLGTGTAALGLACAYYLVKFFDYITNRLGERRELNAAADRMQEMVDVGYKTLAIGDIASIWADGDTNVFVWNPRLRKLKKAADRGLVRMEVRTERDRKGAWRGAHVCLSDVIGIFRTGQIVRVFEENGGR